MNCNFSSYLFILIPVFICGMYGNAFSNTIHLSTEKQPVRIAIQKMLPPEENCMEVNSPRLCYTFSEENPPKQLEAPIKYRWRMGNGYTAWGKTVRYCYPTSGKYQIHLDYIDTLSGIEYLDVGLYNLEIKPKHTLSIILPDSIQQFEPVTITYKNTINILEKESPIWAIDDMNIGHEKSATYQFKEIGKHHLTLSGIPNYKQTDSALCTLKKVIVNQNKDSIKSKQRLELIFNHDDTELAIEHIAALNTLLSIFNSSKSTIFIKETDYSSNKENKLITKKIELYFIENGVSKDKLQFIHNLKISTPPTKYTPKRITISLK